MTGKRGLILSLVSVATAMTLLAGITMAWFSDTESAAADMKAGTLNLVLNDTEGDAVQPLSFLNLQPMTQANYETRLGDADLFKDVVIKSTGSLPVDVVLKLEAPAADGCSVRIPKMIPNEVGGVMQSTDKATGQPETILCTEASENLQDVMDILLYTKEGLTLTPVLGSTGVQVNLKDYPKGYHVGRMQTGDVKNYVVGARMSDTADNTYQALHYHAVLSVNGFQPESVKEAIQVLPADGVRPGTVGGIAVTATTDTLNNDGTSTTSIPLGGAFGSLTVDKSVQTCIAGGSWRTWSGSYTDKVYSTTEDSVTLTMPEDVRAFALYVSPGSKNVYTVTVTLDDGRTIAAAVSGNGGATGFSFASPTDKVKSVKIHCPDPKGFAFGEMFVG